MRKYLLIFPALVLVFFALKHISAPLFFVKEYRFIQTGLLSDDYLSSIKNYATQLFDDHHSAHTIITFLKKEFPVLDKIVVAYRPCGVYVMLYAHKPICCINEDQVLTANNELFTKKYFSINSLDSVAQLTVAENYLPKVSSLIPSLLCELPLDFKQNYDLEFINQRHICVRSKQEKNFSILACAAPGKLSCLLTQCALVKKKLAERKDFNEKSMWIADTRFADYIIAYKT